MEPTVSVIIPTHNRRETLKGLLENLENQTYPLPLVEVIVVADGCNDGTMDMLKNYAAPYLLKYVAQDGKGPAVARNRGAATATGALLLFLDDDIDPSKGLIAAHVQIHNANPGSVVIGYLPIVLPENAGYHHLHLRAWWEQKFQLMSKVGYRYSYEDLLSGNFSLSSQLFNDLSGFDETLKCREDYELGIRLIESGAQFVFSKQAWGYHRDQAAQLNRSFKRKRQEGKADVQIGKTHLELISGLPLVQLKSTSSFSKRLLLFGLFNAPVISDGIANMLQELMSLLERWRLLAKWKRLNLKLHKYWYLRGVVEGAETRQKLAAFFLQETNLGKQNIEIVIDLKEGISRAEEQMDEKRPYSVQLLFNEQPIGTIPYRPGAERLRGVHLRTLLATKFSWSFMQALTLEQEFINLSK